MKIKEIINKNCNFQAKQQQNFYEKNMIMDWFLYGQWMNQDGKRVH